MPCVSLLEGIIGSEVCRVAACGFAVERQHCEPGFSPTALAHKQFYTLSSLLLLLDTPCALPRTHRSPPPSGRSRTCHTPSSALATAPRCGTTCLSLWAGTRDKCDGGVCVRWCVWWRWGWRVVEVGWGGGVAPRVNCAAMRAAGGIQLLSPGEHSMPC